MMLRRKVGELQTLGTHLDAGERCKELEQSLVYYKSKFCNIVLWESGLESSVTLTCLKGD